MTIDREQALQLVTDRLCGELGPEGAAELEAYLAAHPEFVEEVKELEAAWRQLELLADEEGNEPVISPALRRALGLGLAGECEELTDEDLDLAAGGIGRPPGPGGEPPDRS